MNYQWNLDRIYKGFEDPAYETDMQSLQQLVKDFTAFAETLSTVDPLEGLKRILFRADPSAPFPFHRIASPDIQGRNLSVFPGRHPLHVGNDVLPIPSVAQEAVKEGVDAV